MKGSLRFASKLIIILLLFVVLFSYAMFQGGFVSWFLFYSFLPIFLYLIGLLFYPMKGWQIKRKLSHHVVRAGEHVSATLIVERKIPFPLSYCIVEEILPTTLNRIDNRKEKYNYLDQPNKVRFHRKVKKIVFPWFKSTFDIPYTLDYVPRGEHHLAAVRIKTSDLFGMVQKEYVYQVSGELIAYPDERPIFIHENITSFEQGSISSSLLNVKNTNIASGIREYMPGDRFSWIDWKQTAKKNDVMTKEFEQEKSTDSLIVLDSCLYNGMNSLAYEASVEICMSLVETIRKRSAQVGLLSIGEEVREFPVQHDPAKHEMIRKHLTTLLPSETKPFSLKLKEEMQKRINNYYIMVITTSIDAALKDTMKQIKLRKKRVSLILIQAENRISSKEYTLLKLLRNEGISVTILTEKELVKNPIGVNGQ